METSLTVSGLAWGHSVYTGSIHFYMTVLLNVGDVKMADGAVQDCITLQILASSISTKKTS